MASSYLDPGTTFFPGVFLSCVSAVSLLIVLTSWDSSGAQLTCALGLLCCCVSGEISALSLLTRLLSDTLSISGVVGRAGGMRRVLSGVGRWRRRLRL